MPKFEFPANLAELPEPVQKAVYASAGAAELALEAVRKYAEELEKKVVEYRDEAPSKFADAKEQISGIGPKDIPGKAKESASEFADASKKFASALQEEAKNFPGVAKEKLTTEQLGATYEDLAQRGEAFLAKLRGDDSEADTTDTADAPDESTDEPADIVDAEVIEVTGDEDTTDAADATDAASDAEQSDAEQSEDDGPAKA